MGKVPAQVQRVSRGRARLYSLQLVLNKIRKEANLEARECLRVLTKVNSAVVAPLPEKYWDIRTPLKVFISADGL